MRKSTIKAIEHLIAMADHATWDMGARGSYDPPECLPGPWEEPWFDAFQFRTDEDYRHRIIAMVDVAFGPEHGEGGEPERQRVMANYIHDFLGDCAPDCQSREEWERQRLFTKNRLLEEKIQTLEKECGPEPLEAFKAATRKLLAHNLGPAFCDEITEKLFDEHVGLKVHAINEAAE